MDEQDPDLADLNIERLLSEAYQPESINVEFARKTVNYLEKLAAERRKLPSAWRQVAWLYFANAVAILLLIAMPPLFWYYFVESQEQEPVQKGQQKPALLPLLEVGETATTKANQKQTFRLPDSSLLSLAGKTTVRLDAPGVLTLLEGEISVSPADNSKPFIIRTPKPEARVEDPSTRKQ